jgi:uncharacterized protein with PQ loop repeat
MVSHHSLSGMHIEAVMFACFTATTNWLTSSIMFDILYIHIIYYTRYLLELCLPI